MESITEETWEEIKRLHRDYYDPEYNKAFLEEKNEKEFPLLSAILTLVATTSGRGRKFIVVDCEMSRLFDYVVRFGVPSGNVFFNIYIRGKDDILWMFKDIFKDILK
jgi:hypothetical protein